MIDFIASETHYVDHLAPIWVALPDTVRGSFIVPDAASVHARSLGIRPVYEGNGDVLVGASWPDVANSHYRRTVLMEHGIGQTYQGLEWNPHYAGGSTRAGVDLFLNPNGWVALLNQQANPGALHYTIGSPFVDMLRVNLKSASERAGSYHPVAVSFHYSGGDLCPEMGNAFSWIKDELPKVHERFSLLGHAHPREWPYIRDWYVQHEIPAAWWFPVVASTASVYICDNSSTLYQFAALNKPVVVLNPPQYRREVRHGLRFWQYADVGHQVDTPSHLLQAVEWALEDEPAIADRRQAITAKLFPHAGEGANRAVDALVSLL